MSLETPNQIRANATGLTTLLTVGAPSTFDVRLLTSAGFAAVRLLEADDDQPAVLTLSEEISPLEAAVFGGGNSGPFDAAIFGGSAAADIALPGVSLAPNDLVVESTGDFDPFEAGQQRRWWATVFHLPLAGV